MEIAWYYAPGYDYGRYIPKLPRDMHGFQRDKPSQLRAHLERLGALRPGTWRAPTRVAETELAEIHAPAVVRGLHKREAIARALELGPLGLLPTLILRQAAVLPQLLAAGGTCAAFEDAALRGTWAFNLSGGFHHARPQLAHGFCLLNDVALAYTRLRRRYRIAPWTLILDLDLHQGDGNAAAFAQTPEVFTASLHQASAFPHPKLRSDLDVELPDGCQDEAYLNTLDTTLDRIRDVFAPEVIVYLAGSDPYALDPLGKLSLSAEGLRARDERVARFALDQGAALVSLPAGGYSPQSARLTAAGFAAMANIARA